MTTWKTIDRCQIAEISTLGTFRFKKAKTVNGWLPEREIEVVNGYVQLPTYMASGDLRYIPMNTLELMVRHFIGKSFSFRKVSFKDRDNTNIAMNNLIY